MHFSKAGACVLVWHLAMCLELLTHKLVGRALVVEVLSAFSENGRTPCQGLKALAATSSDERCVHMALCAMEALISYPLCEYDDLVAAGCALPRRHDASHREHDREEDVQEKASIRSSSSDIIRYQSSSLTGYDLVTGNQALKTLSITVSEDGGDEEDRRLSDGIGTFREVVEICLFLCTTFSCLRRANIILLPMFSLSPGFRCSAPFSGGSEQQDLFVLSKRGRG